MPSSKWLVTALTALALLMLAAAFLESAVAGSEYVLRPALKRVELTDRTPITLYEKTYESLGGTYRLSLTGIGNPLYSNGLFLLPNETGILDLRLEILRAPSGFKLAAESIWMNPEWCDVHFELSAEGLAQPIRERALSLEIEKYAVQGSPLSLKLEIKPYAFKEALPYGWVEGCDVRIVLYGNASFGANAEEKSWSIWFPVYVLKPEEKLGVEVRNPVLSFEVERRRDSWASGDFIKKISLEAKIEAANNLDSDVVLEKVVAVVALGPNFSEASRYSYETELDYILKPGQVKSIKLEKKWEGYFTKELWSRPNGTVMIKLFYLSEKGKGIKRFFYAYDLREAEKLSPQAAATTSKATTISQSRSYTAAQTSTFRSVSSTLTSRSKPGGGGGLVDLLGDLGRIIMSPVTILLVLGLVLSIACFIAKKGGGGRAEAQAKAAPPPPPSPGKSKPAASKTAVERIIPRWAYGECLKLMNDKYREFRSLRQAGQLRYAIYALHDGLEAALKLLARESGVLGLQPDTRLTLGEVVKLLKKEDILSDLEYQLIHEVARIRNKYKHRDLTAEPMRYEVDRAASAYLILMRQLKTCYDAISK